MLSGETAAGLYPEEAVKTMRNIAVSAEAAQDYKKLLSDRTKLVETSLVNYRYFGCTYSFKLKC